MILMLGVKDRLRKKVWGISIQDLFSTALTVAVGHLMDHGRTRLLHMYQDLVVAAT